MVLSKCLLRYYTLTTIPWGAAAGRPRLLPFLKSPRHWQPTLFSTSPTSPAPAPVACRPTLIILDGVLETVTDPVLVAKYRANQLKAIDKLDKTVFGLDLADRVAAKISEGHALHEVHRDYGGIGIFPLNFHPYKPPCKWETPPRGFGVYHVNDGFPGALILKFEHRDAFVAWLAAQSDYSMSGGAPGEMYEEEPFNINNQRITRQDLNAFLDPSNTRR